MKKSLCFTLLTLSCWIIAHSQNGYTPAVSTLTFSGTAHQTALMIDNSGHKWIGMTSTVASQGGLVYYDGINWTLYNTASTPSMPSNLVQCLAKDNSGNVWIGTPAGLVKWNSGNFTTYTTANGLPGNDIKSLASSGNMLYVGTYHGLSRFDGSNFTNYNLGNGGLATDTVNALDVENANTIWVGSYSRLVKFSINSTYTSFSSQSYFISGSVNFINSIYHDAQNVKWIGTSSVPAGYHNYSMGLLAFNGNVFTKADSLYEIHGSLIPAKVVDICEGPHGGVAFSGGVGPSPYSASSSCILELIPGGRVYQYFCNNNNFNNPSPTLWNIGDFVEKDGANLLISHDGSLANYNNNMRVMYYEFDPTHYSGFNLGSTVNNDNLKMLDINGVKAGVANRGDMHWDVGGSGQPLYVVPKTNDRKAYISSSNASALWISGYDGGGLLHGAGQTYRQSGTDFWPGPLDTTNASTIDSIAAPYDKVWKVSYTDINDFVTNFNNGNVQNNSFMPTEDILTWPAHGNGDVARNLAPFVDLNHNGIYDPLVGGDYPQIKGDQALYFIFNDGPQHIETGCNPFGFEIHGMAYGYGCPAVLQSRPELNYTTFYNYKIINRSSNTYYNVQLGLWSDADVGYYLDDFVGCNVQENYGYVYNGDGYDDSVAGTNGYGNHPPAQGYALMQGPIANNGDGIDNDHDGTVDEAGEQCLMGEFMYFNNNFPGTPVQTQEPSNCSQYNYYLNAHWADNTPLTCGGDGYGGSVPTHFAFPDNTDPSGNCAGWTEISAGNQPNDRRIIVGTGPFSIAPGQSQEVEYALVTSFDSSSTPNVLNKLQNDIQQVRSFYNLTNKPGCLVTAITGVEEQKSNIQASVYPNPTSSQLTVQVAGQPEKVQYELCDVLGHTVLSGTQRSDAPFVISVAELQDGVYFLKLRTSNGFAVKKIVKE